MILGKNKKAYFDYSIVEEFEAGIVLEGWEVKSIKNSMFNLKDSHVKVSEKGASLVDMHVSRWKTQSRTIPIDEKRERKILLKKNEIKKLQEYRRNSGVSILPLKVFTLRNKVKVGIGVGKGKKKYDKREAIKTREFKRDLQRSGKKW